MVSNGHSYYYNNFFDFLKKWKNIIKYSRIYHDLA